MQSKYAIVIFLKMLQYGKSVERNRTAITKFMLVINYVIINLRKLTLCTNFKDKSC